MWMQSMICTKCPDNPSNICCILLKTTNVSLLVMVEEMSEDRQSKEQTACCLGIMNASTECHADPSNGCWDISVVDQLTNMFIPRAAHVAKKILLLSQHVMSSDSHVGWSEKENITKFDTGKCSRNTRMHKIWHQNRTSNPADKADADNRSEKKLVMKRLQTQGPQHMKWRFLWSNVTWDVCPHECEPQQEHMKEAAASHLQRARIICLFLHLSFFLSLQCSPEDGGRVTARGRPSAPILFCSKQEMPEVHHNSDNV